MADPISNATSLRELGLNQSRTPAAPAAPAAAATAPDPSTNLTPVQRVEVLQAAVEKLIKKSLPANSKLHIFQDKSTGEFIYRSVDPNTGEVIKQWPSEKLLELRKDLKAMEGLLIDTQV